MSDITKLKIEDEAQLIELLSENVIAPYMLLTEKCESFMWMEIGYCNTQPVKIDEENQAYVVGKTVIGKTRSVNVRSDGGWNGLHESEYPSNVNLDVTCNGFIRFYSPDPEKKLMWLEPAGESVAILKEIPRQEPPPMKL